MQKKKYWMIYTNYIFVNLSRNTQDGWKENEKREGKEYHKQILLTNVQWKMNTEVGKKMKKKTFT